MSKDAYDLLQIILAERRNEDYPNKTESSFFEIFAAQQVLKECQYNLDSDEIESGIVGGGLDGGIDAFYMFANRRYVREDSTWTTGQKLDIELVIIQAKRSPSFSEEVPRKMKDFVENCLRISTVDTINADTSKLYSEQLKTFVKKFQDIYLDGAPRGSTLCMKFFHVTTGHQVDENHIINGQLLTDKSKEYFHGAQSKYTCINATRLLDLFRKQPPQDLLLKPVSYVDCSSNDCDAYLCIARLKDFFDFITENGRLREYIFEENVRAHAGSNVKVNKGIKESLSSSPEVDFWWLNNGITIIASNVAYKGRALVVSNPSIVNGLQTSYQVFNYFNELPGDRQDDRNIMIKVIGTKSEEISAKIINATNSQTPISPVSLRATDSIQLHIEIALRSEGYYYDRRKNYYRNQGKPVSRIITMLYMAQAICAIVLQRPDDARARPSTAAENKYGQLFSTTYPIALYTSCVKIMKKVDDFLESMQIDPIRKNNLMFYIAMYAPCSALRTQKPDRQRICLFDMALLTDELLNECYDLVLSAFDGLGGSDQVAKGTVLTQHLVSKLEHDFPIRRRAKEGTS